MGKQTYRSGGYCVTLVYPIPLLPSGPGGVFRLQLRSPPDLCGQAGCSLKRREWDSNPRWSYPHTRFPSVLLKPLGHLSGGSHCQNNLSNVSHPGNQNGARQRLLEHGFEIDDQFAVIDSAERLRILAKLRQRLRELCATAIDVAPAEVVHPDSGLDQTLVEQA